MNCSLVAITVDSVWEMPKKSTLSMPTIPVIYFDNGGFFYLELQRDMEYDMVAVDWSVDLSVAREILGPDISISGNINPTVLF